MDKAKIALTLLSIAIVVGPIAGMVIIYRDNLSALVYAPEIENMIVKGQVGDITASDFIAPTLASEPQYDPDTGAFKVDFNFTNPLSNQISVEEFSAQIKSGDTDALLGNIALAAPINIAAGDNGIVDVVGNLSQETINQLQAQYSHNGTLNLIVENIDATVAGVHLHLDRFDLGSVDLGAIQFPR